jgi:DNA-binding transcriptional MocR family regulator
MGYSWPMDIGSIPLYQALAGELASLIEAGGLPPRQRLPSVRQLAAQRGVSVTTAVATFRHLEERGLIEARPKSGYFVTARRKLLPEPAPVSLPRRARLVGTPAMLKRLADAGVSPLVARLGQAVPDPDLFPEAALRAGLREATRRNSHMLVDYPLRVGGSPGLRSEIARHYAQFGVALDADALVITNGCMEALTLAVQAVVPRGGTIAVESPTYYGFLQIAEHLGVKVIEIAAHARDGFSIEALRDLLLSPAGREVRACALTPNFSNPTGSLMPEERKRELVRLCESADIALIEDDVYGDLPFNGVRPLPCQAFDRDGRVLLCSSFSKTLAPGARIGFLAAGRHRDTVRAAKSRLSGATALLSQEMLREYLAGGRYVRHLRRLQQVFAAQVEQVSQAVQQHFPAGTRLSRPQGGFVLWVELPQGVDTLSLHEAANRGGADFVPGVLFSVSGRYANFLRLNCGHPFTARAAAAIRDLGVLFGAPASR